MGFFLLLFKNVMALKKLKKLKKPRKSRKLRKVKFPKFKVGSSKVEKKFKLYLNSLGIEVETQYRINWSFYDFKVKGKNILIEFDGDYYHTNPKVFPHGPINNMQKKSFLNDKKKNFLAEKNGFVLIRIWENDFHNNEFEVRKKLLALI